MNYFIVFQNKTYDEEKNGGYLWAPKRTASGKKIYHWSNMTKVNEGDIIFSMYKRNLVSVNIAKSKSINNDRPIALDSINLWEKEGWLINVEYNTLENTVVINNYIDDILKLCPSKYSPFTKAGKGNQGYLFEVGKDLGDYLMKLVRDSNGTTVGIKI